MIELIIIYTPPILAIALIFIIAEIKFIKRVKKLKELYNAESIEIDKLESKLK
jgi:hypothetical protein